MLSLAVFTCLTVPVLLLSGGAFAQSDDQSPEMKSLRSHGGEIEVKQEELNSRPAAIKYTREQLLGLFDMAIKQRDYDRAVDIRDQLRLLGRQEEEKRLQEKEAKRQAKKSLENEIEETIDQQPAGQ